MKIFILEDDPQRMKLFNRALMKHTVVHFDNVFKAIEYLKNDSKFDAFFLDHDLDLKTYVDSNEENTGYQLAKWLKENNIKGQKVIHSLNPVGSQRMHALLEDSQMIPFYTLIQAIQANVTQEF